MRTNDVKVDITVSLGADVLPVMTISHTSIHSHLFHHTLHMVPYSTTHYTWSPIPPHTAHGPLFHYTLHMVPYSNTHYTWSPIPPHTAHGLLFHHTLHMVPYSITHPHTKLIPLAILLTKYHCCSSLFFCT